ncbi:MAG: hypothetical protein ABJH07_00645 [Sedimentitalea sp.]|uniref:hypothetical protein n=1 Tax=Sedimentitalea sp. TaxID=2048915 RepID=UPI003263A6D3
MDYRTLQEARVALMINDARRRIARLAGFPAKHHRCVENGHERHYIACRGTEIEVDPASRSSQQILRQWKNASESAL